MRIALIASSTVTVPPAEYGAVEIVIAELGKMLTRLGHSVVVYASGDSTPACTLSWRVPKATPHAPPERELRHHAFAWGDIASRTIPFDIVHAHHPTALALRGASRAPTVFTLHHDRDDALLETYADHRDVCYVAMSDGQVDRVREVDIAAVVHAGLDPDEYPQVDATGEYCAFLGKLTPEKAPHLAIDAARLAGVPLALCAPETPTSSEYVAQEIQPRLDAAGGAVELHGALARDRRLALLQNARALLLPLDCDDPCTLVSIESMLAGTPVIAFARGSAPEIVEDGVTGFVVRDTKEMAARLREVGSIDRGRCRERAIERWSSLRMARAYEGIYECLLSAKRPREIPAREMRPRAPVPAVVLEPKRRWSGLFSPLWTA